MSNVSSLWFVFDIDGVLTSGIISTDGVGNILKSINMKDIDAIHELSRMGCCIVAITSEKDKITEWIRKKFPWNEFFDGVLDKKEQLEILKNKYQIQMENLFYIGDGKKDLGAFEIAGTTICPSDAITDIHNKADICLKRNAGSGALWELVQIAISRKSVFKDDKDFADQDSTVIQMWLHNLEEHRRLVELMNNDEIVYHISASAKVICRAIRNGNKIVLFGNGGSAADAQHIAAEFVGKFKVNRHAWNAIALTTNTSIITAIANDFDYLYVFSRQVSAIVNEGDVVVGISTSGKSENVIEGIREAKKHGANTILLTGGKANTDIVDINIQIPSTQTPNIQEMHILIGHFWTDYVERNIK